MVFVQDTSTNSRGHHYNTDEARRNRNGAEVFTKTVYIISTKFGQSSIRLLNNLANLVVR